MVVVGRDDRRTEGDVRVKGKGCVGLVMSGIDKVESSSNVMTRPVVTTCLTTLNVMRERRELDGVSRWIVLPTYTLFLFVYVYA